MERPHAIITGIAGYVPDYILTNDELSRMVDTSDEWIMTRIGVKERRILNEEGLGPSYMARKAVKRLLEKTGTDPLSVDAVICSTSTADYHFPSTASIVLGKCGLTNAHAFELSAACSGFLYAMDQASCMIESGRYKKIATERVPHWWSPPSKTSDGKTATCAQTASASPTSVSWLEVRPTRPPTSL